MERLPSLIDMVDFGKSVEIPPETMLKTLTKLYEDGVCSYPRTDCNYLPSNAYQDARFTFRRLLFFNIVEIANGGTIDRTEAFNDAKIGDHTAIIPVCRGKFNEEYLAKMKNDKIEFIVFQEIVRRFMCAIFPVMVK